MRTDGFDHNEYTLPADLVNIGRKCADCRSKHVVYEITVPGPGFPRGFYCFKCLLARCKAAGMFPTPIEKELLTNLENALGLYPGKTLYFPVPDLSKLR